MGNHFFTLEEVAELFGVNYQLIYKLVKNGELPSVRIGKVYRVSESQLKEYMDRQSTGVPASGRNGIICSCCGRIFYSALSIGTHCKICGAPICRLCEGEKHMAYCEIHTLEANDKEDQDV